MMIPVISAVQLSFRSFRVLNRIVPRPAKLEKGLYPQILAWEPVPLDLLKKSILEFLDVSQIAPLVSIYTQTLVAWEPVRTLVGRLG